MLQMRIMGEAKLAINNLYIRISRKTTKSNDSDDLPGPSLTLPAGKSEGLQEMASSQHEDKNMTEKLHAIQDRLLDLQLVVHKVEQYKK